MENNKTILIMAGGTGGHVMPALAVAIQLTEKGYNVHWLGTKHGIEARIVTNAKIPISYINIQGIRGKGFARLISAPIKLIRALWQANKIIRQVKPLAVLSMGGYVAGPGGIAAWLNRIPLLVHEQNAVSGLTNKLLAPFAKTIMISFPDAFKFSDKVKLTGNPVRKEIMAVRAESPSEAKEKLNILILGGSQGAISFNTVLPEVMANLHSKEDFNVWHQTGEKNYSFTRELYDKLGLEAFVEPFIEDMAKAYSWADVVICRSGALTIAELAIVGRASILIPFPYATDDHQTKNAKYLADNKAAILVNHNDLNVSTIKQILLKLMQNKQDLTSMAFKCHSLAHKDATFKVVDYCIEAATSDR